MMTDKTMDLEFLKEKKTLSDLDLKLFAILNDVLQPEVSLYEREAAKRIDELAPLGHQSEDGNSNDESIEDFLWSLWSLVIEVIQLSETSLWEGLPLLGAFMRDNWISPTYNSEVPEVQSAEKWANLNSFAARLFGESLAQWKNFAVWSLNAALEEEIQDQKILICNITVAREWITQAGERIFREANEHPSDKECRVMSAGSLYNGKAGLSFERWEFWKKRFREIGRLTSGDISKVCIAMADKMDGIGGTLDQK
ncbi:uncharacterized protein N7503_007034 [Penicillium pulvis]|uniref:uncharacterized protein n=1 Tax=Penicillium pulvis TaxID=1562058 RepID=UPI0025498695|nr:uncharacterized protein N7503_007034 [Penicillium pulvis]KAJ5797738.1 hypothetical protein N7503_007034 [Penicillium pulvis]